MNERQQHIQNVIKLADFIADYRRTEAQRDDAKARWEENSGHEEHLAWIAAEDANSAALAALKTAVETFPEADREMVWQIVNDKLLGLS